MNPNEFRPKNRKLTNNFEKQAESFVKEQLSESMFIETAVPVKVAQNTENKSQVSNVQSKADL